MTNIRVNVTLATVLETLTGIVRDKLGLNESTCYWSTDAEGSPAPASSDLFCVLTPDGGDFDAELFDGGAREQLTVTTGVFVTLWSTIRLDRAGRDSESLLNDNRGSVVMLSRILRALTGDDPLFDGDKALRELIRPRGFHFRKHNAKDNLSGVSVSFELTFDWDLAE